ncbi:MAG: DegT/DnrJ/EryC1/StrS aminotransferase family protein [Candidatus Uhrbacteria bacterium]
MRKTLFTGFAPNLTAADTCLALSYLLLPWKWSAWKKGSDEKIANEKLKKYFSTNYAQTFDSGRNALYFALKALGVEKDDEVLVQAYTCVIVANAIIWTGAKPVYVDIQDDLNMNPDDLAKKITSKSKVLIIQHTFGLRADTDKLLALAAKYSLKVIEDCAHAFGLTWQNKKLGTLGDIGMLSFGSDKILSTVRGGALITNDPGLGDKIEILAKELNYPTSKIIAKILLHYPSFFIGKMFYGFWLGKIWLAFFKKINLLPKILEATEKKSDQTAFRPYRFPNSLAGLLLQQLNQVDKVNLHRQKIAKIFQEQINNPKIAKPWTELKSANLCLRYPIFTKQPSALINYAKKHGVILGDWYNQVIAPKDSDLVKAGYLLGSCPQAEKLAKTSVNLPTNRHISLKDAGKIVKIINNF